MILTYKYRIKDKSARKTLRRHAVAVNQVWNYYVAHQRDIERRYRAGAPKRRWPRHFELCTLTKGASKELNIHAGTVQSVSHRFSCARDHLRHAPRFRVSGGARRSLGWVPFQPTNRQIYGNSIIYLGKKYRFWEAGRPLPETAKGGCFAEDARGRWYVCFELEVDDHTKAPHRELGIDLGLKSLASCSDGAKIPALQHHRQY